MVCVEHVDGRKLEAIVPHYACLEASVCSEPSGAPLKL